MVTVTLRLCVMVAMTQTACDGGLGDCDTEALCDGGLGDCDTETACDGGCDTDNELGVSVGCGHCL